MVLFQLLTITLPAFLQTPAGRRVPRALRRSGAGQGPGRGQGLGVGLGSSGILPAGPAMPLPGWASARSREA